MWYAEQISVQLEDMASVEDAIIEPVDLCMARMKEASASWLVQRRDYIVNNPQFIVNGFPHAGISKALNSGGFRGGSKGSMEPPFGFSDDRRLWKPGL